MPNKITTYMVYEQSYIDKCKAFWYANGRPSSDTKIREMLEDSNLKDDKGRIPSTAMIGSWRQEYGWDAWADIMDAEANEIVERDLISQKAEMLRKQAQRGFELQEIGMAYLKSEDGGFDSSSAAVQAVIKGAELERTSRGIGEMLLKMAKMSDADLKDELIKRIQRASDAGAINVEEVPEEKSESPEP